MNWNDQGGVRERLALLAEIGPNLDGSAWAYDSHHDRWSYIGGALEIQGKVRAEVRQEGSASLALIAERWNLNRRQALEFIGYPER